MEQMTLPTITREYRFIEGFRSFTPSLDDNPDNILFYRTAAGLEAAWGTEFRTNYNTVWHHVSCEASHIQDPIEVYKQALKSLQYFLDGYQVPEAPKYRGYYESAPEEPTDLEKKAKELFNVQFKRAYPKVKLNSKEAKAKWEELREKAQGVILAEYDRKLKTYQEKEAHIDRENAKAREEWLDGIHSRALFEDTAMNILKELQNSR